MEPAHQPTATGIDAQPFGRQLMEIAGGPTPGLPPLPRGVPATAMRLDDAAVCLRRIEAVLPGLPTGIRTVVGDAMKDIHERVRKLMAMVDRHDTGAAA